MSKKKLNTNSDPLDRRIDELKREQRKQLPPPSRSHRNNKKDTRLRRRNNGLDSD
jgi:hypothetical protein